MNSPVEKIKERLSIEDVVSSYIKLERAGANLKARCPFHNEKTPSFFVSPERGGYYCFGCGAKGDIFTFVEEFEGLDFKGALKLLAARAGVPLEKFNPEEESEKERLYRIMKEAADFFVSNLLNNREALEYLKSRGLTEVSISDFEIGFAKDDWRELYFYLQKKGFTDSDIERAGLSKKSEKGFYDRFRSRIMFPIADSSGRIIAFTGRLFSAKGGSASGGKDSSVVQAKYLNSPETPIFSKSSVLYGLDKAKESIRKNNFSILVEGQFDLILSHQAGFRNTVAGSGTALSDSEISKENVVSNLGLLRRLTGNIVLAYDADKAGIKAAERSSKIALSLGMDVKAASLPEGVDPADLISLGHGLTGEAKDGPEAWRLAIRSSKHIIEFLLEKTMAKSSKDPRYIGREIKEKILPYVDALESSIEKAHFIKLISDRSGIPEGALKEDLGKVERESRHEKNEIKNAEELGVKAFRKDYIEHRLLGIILWQKSLANSNTNTDSILGEYAEILGKSPEKILDGAKDIKEDLIFEAEVFYGEGENLNKEILELLSNLREESLKEELWKKMQELRLAEAMHDSKKSGETLITINEINKKIQSIKSGRIKN